jgi:hypothetical protein
MKKGKQRNEITTLWLHIDIENLPRISEEDQCGNLKEKTM